MPFMMPSTSGSILILTTLGVPVPPSKPSKNPQFLHNQLFHLSLSTSIDRLFHLSLMQDCPGHILAAPRKRFHHKGHGGPATLPKLQHVMRL